MPVRAERAARWRGSPSRRDRGPRGRRRFSLVATSVLFVLVAAGVWWGVNYYRGCREAPPANGTTVALEVPDGASGEDVVGAMADAGLIRCGGFMGNLMLRGTGKANKIRAGTYELRVGLTLDEIVEILTTPPPPIPTVEVTVPEGLRIRSTYPGERSISSVVADQLGLSPKAFANLAESGRYSLPPYLPKGRSLEGFLFPKSYPIPEAELSADFVIRRMLAQFEKEAASMPWENAEELGVTPYEVVIIASMIEREAKVDDDRALIAGVIYNRLRDGVNLGIDATLLYDDPTPDGQLTTPDLETDSPYNTRLNPGLPPTPIASPGRESLEAALNPAETRFMYYVLCDDDGGHKFAVTYEEHLQNVEACLG